MSIIWKKTFGIIWWCLSDAKFDIFLLAQAREGRICYIKYDTGAGHGGEMFQNKRAASSRLAWAT
jgi:hypothetical protein